MAMIFSSLRCEITPPRDYAYIARSTLMPTSHFTKDGRRSWPHCRAARGFSEAAPRSFFARCRREPFRDAYVTLLPVALILPQPPRGAAGRDYTARRALDEHSL